MKKAIALLLMISLLTGCADEQKAESASASEQTASTTQQTTTTTADTTAQTTTAAKPVDEPVEVGYTIYEAPSEGNVFVDFDYIEDIVGMSPDALEDEVLQRAIDVLVESEDYITSHRDFLKEYEALSETLVSVSAYKETAPQLYRAFRSDFDGNGTDEHFLLLAAPYKCFSDGEILFVYYLVFVPSQGEAQYISQYCDSVSVDLLDYGMCRHIIVQASASIGAWCHTELFGVDGGKVVEHYSFRGGFSKVDCFLSAFGWQAAGGFYYYDTIAKEYRAILGEEIPLETIQEMDSTKVLDGFADLGGNLNVIAVMMCNKFYVIADTGMFAPVGVPFLYENGAFTDVSEDYAVRCSYIADWLNMDYVKNVDYDAATGSMLTPTEAADCT